MQKHSALLLAIASFAFERAQKQDDLGKRNKYAVIDQNKYMHQKETVKKRTMKIFRKSLRRFSRLVATVSAAVLSSVCAAQAVPENWPQTHDDVRAAIESVAARLNAGRTEAVLPEFELTVAVSLSLQADYLAQLARAVDRIGGRFVVRGLQTQALGGRHPYAWFSLSKERQAALRAETLAQLKRLAQSTAPAGASIDPLFFRRHAVEGVPVFAVSWHSENKGEGARRTALVRGALTPDAALETLARESAAIDAPDDERRRLAAWALEKAALLQGRTR